MAPRSKMQQLDLFGSAPSPAPPPPKGRTEPLIWIAELLVLRDLDRTETSIVRSIKMRRGLNVLWAPPSPEDIPNRLGDGQITGHTAGKTTFCRLIRYVLGETRFGTTRAQERIREALPEGWVMAQVVVDGERWSVGRPFALGVHPFAVRGASPEEAIRERGRGGYQDFLAAVAAATVGKVQVAELPHAHEKLGWEHVLPWLMRDQESRFAGLVEWRDPSSESESPRLVLDDRHVVVRAVLGLMSDEESAAQRRIEEQTAQKEKLELEAPRLLDRASEDRRRLLRLIGVEDDTLDAGPLFAARLHEHVAARRAALAQAEAAIEGKVAEVERAEAAREEATEASGARQQDVREAERAITLAEARRSARSRPRPDGRREAGVCRVPLARALAEGCPLATAEAQKDAAACEHEPAPEEAAQLEAALGEARRALAEARRAQQAQREEHERLWAELSEARERVARDRQALEELARLWEYVESGEKSTAQNARRLAAVTAEVRESSERQQSLQREHAAALGRVSERFRDVVRALLGEHVGARVDVKGRRMELIIDDRGERDGAAMTTLKLLAFDLCALKLGTEASGQFPGFLVHDGPREADMDGRIYERVFLYAKQLEDEVPAGMPAFQYIVTTTAPPPVVLQKAPWLLEPLLDASRPEGRLLGMDL